MNLFTAYLKEGLYLVDKALNSINREIISDERSHEYKEEFIDSKEIVSKANTGYSCNGEHFLPADCANFAVTGISGVGKSSVLSYPTLQNINNNYIVNDCSGELLSGAGKLVDNAFTIKVTNISHPEKSNGFFNPLSYIKNHSDIFRIVHLIVIFTLSGSSEKFWAIQSENILSLVIRILLYQDRKFLNLTNVRHVIEMLGGANTTFVDKLVFETNNPEIINTYKSHLAVDIKTRSNIIASALSCLQHWANPSIQQLTSYDSMDLHLLKSDKYALFIQSETLHQSYNSLITSLLVRQIITEIMSDIPDSNSRRIFLLLDEFSSMYIPDIDIIISNIRKYRSSLCIMIQSYSQLESRYDARIAKTILTNCAARLFFTALDYETASQLSNELGKYSYGENGSRKERELITSQELDACQRMKPFCCTIIQVRQN